MKLPIIIIGAGGHATVLADALLAAGEKIIGFTGVDPKSKGKLICGLQILGDDSILATYSPETVYLVNGIGSTSNVSTRMSIQECLQSKGWHFTSVRHPSAIVSPYACIAADVQLLAASVLQAGAFVGAGCIVNTAAIIEHGAQIGVWSHIAPRALLCGETVIGARCHVGAGAVVRQGLHIGDDSVIGAGAVVINNFNGSGTLIGVPARLLEKQI